MMRVLRTFSAVLLGKRRAILLVLTVSVLVVIPTAVHGYTTGVLGRAFLFAVLALSLDVAWGYTGILSFGHGAFFGLGAYALGISLTHVESPVAAYGVGALLGLAAVIVIAFLVGVFAFYSPVSAFYIAVLTLALGIVLERIALELVEWTGGAGGLSAFPTPQLPIEQWYWAMLSLLIVSGLVAWIVVRSDFGRLLIAIRDNESRATYLGYRAPLVKLLVFVATAGVASLAGMVYALFANFVAPTLVGFLVATEALIWVALGGRGTLLGPIVGTILITLLGADLSARYPFVWTLLIGALFMLVITFSLGGLYGIATRIVQRVIRPQQASREVALVTVSHRDRPSAVGGVVGILKGVRKSFGSLQVLRGVDLTLRRGEIIGLIGPNGAGKSTLVNVLTDGRQLSGGSAILNGRSIDGSDQTAIVRAGVGRTFQAPNIFPELTVADHLFLAGRRGALPSPFRRTPDVAVTRAALRVTEATNLTAHLGVKGELLPHGMKKALELTMVLALDPDILLLDEPTAGLTITERTRIGDLLGELAEEGLTVLLIEHDLEFVRRIANRVAILHDGDIQLSGEVEEVASSPRLREIYLGEGV